MKSGYKLSAVDIFCGCGDLSEGFSQAGFEIILGIDTNPWAIKTYNKYHGDRGRIRDVTEVDADYVYNESGRKAVDVLIGGPPCQAFSNIEVAKWRSVGMPSTIKHPLNTLYKEFLRLVLDLNPKFFVIENVERMLSIKEGIVKRTIELALRGKYYVSFYVKNVADFGVPQHRKRVLVIGNRLGYNNPLLEATYSDRNYNKKPYVTVRDAIADLPIIKLSKPSYQLSKTS